MNVTKIIPIFPSQNALISKELVSKLEGKASDILDQQQYAMVREALSRCESSWVVVSRGRSKGCSW